MKEKVFKFHFNILALITGLLFIFAISFVIFNVITFLKPLDFLPPGLTNKEIKLVHDNSYFFVGSFQNIISFTFLCVAAFFFLIYCFDLFFRSGAAHILIVEIANLVLVVYYIIRSVYCFQAGGLNVAGGFFNAVAAALLLFMLWYYPLKALDGDCRRGYLVFWIAGFVFGLFGSVSTYNFLDFHSNAGNIVYWNGIISTRLMYIVSIINLFVNYNKDFDPDPLVLDEFANKSDKILGK